MVECSIDTQGFFLYSNMAVVCVSDVHCIFVPLESCED